MCRLCAYDVQECARLHRRDRKKNLFSHPSWNPLPRWLRPPPCHGAATRQPDGAPARRRTQFPLTATVARARTQWTRPDQDGQHESFGIQALHAPHGFSWHGTGARLAHHACACATEYLENDYAAEDSSMLLLNARIAVRSSKSKTRWSNQEFLRSEFSLCARPPTPNEHA